MKRKIYELEADNPKAKEWCEEVNSWLIDELPANLHIQIITRKKELLEHFGTRDNTSGLCNVERSQFRRGVRDAYIGIYKKGKKTIQQIYLHELIHVLRIISPHFRKQLNEKFAALEKGMSWLVEQAEKDFVKEHYRKREWKEEIIVHSLHLAYSLQHKLVLWK